MLLPVGFKRWKDWIITAGSIREGNKRHPQNNPLITHFGGRKKINTSSYYIISAFYFLSVTVHLFILVPLKKKN